MYVNQGDSENEDPETQQDDEALLLKQEHAKFVMKSMMKLPRGMVGQDGGQPWFLFWNLHSLDLLKQPNLRVDSEMKERCISYLS